MLLHARSITHFYGTRLIFKDISLSVRRGTITLLAGANGAGKSTLMKILAGLVEPSSGEIELQGNSSSSNAELPVIGYIGHQTWLYPELSALENLQFWSDLYGLSATLQDFEAILTRVDLSPFAQEKAKNFSRGMAQRLNLARVFLLRPSILLLDEPGTGLDVRSSDILHKEILNAKIAGAGIVWITHSVNQDISCADMIALMEKRTLAYYGPADEYRDQPPGHTATTTNGSNPTPAGGTASSGEHQNGPAASTVLFTQMRSTQACPAQGEKPC